MPTELIDPVRVHLVPGVQLRRLLTGHLPHRLLPRVRRDTAAHRALRSTDAA